LQLVGLCDANFKTAKFQQTKTDILIVKWMFIRDNVDRVEFFLFFPNKLGNYPHAQQT